MTKQQLNYFRPYINKEDRKVSCGKYKNLYETEHHIVPKSQRGSNVEDNKIMLIENFHNDRHGVYGNATPIQQIDQRLRVNRKALSLEFQNDIAKLLSETDDQYYYKNGILLRK